MIFSFSFLFRPQCLKKNDCMLVGADVTHPSPDAINIPSIAAVSITIMYEYNALKYNILSNAFFLYMSMCIHTHTHALNILLI